MNMSQVYQRVRKYKKDPNRAKELYNWQKYIRSKQQHIRQYSEQVINLKVKQIEITQAKQKPKQKSICFNEGSLRDLCENSKCMNICIIGIPKGEEREKKREENYLKK